MPYMKNGVRDYATEYNKYHSRRKQKDNRASRNRAHKMMEKRLGHNITADVDHKKPLSKGGGNGLSNLRVRSRSANRSFPRTRSGAMR